MNLKDLFIDTIQDIVKTFMGELKEMFEQSVQNIAIDPDCIDFYIKVQKILVSEPVTNKPEAKNVMDIVLLEYRKNVNPHVFEHITKSRSAQLTDKNVRLKEEAATEKRVKAEMDAKKSAKKKGGALARESNQHGGFIYGNKKGGAAPPPPEPLVPDTHRIILEPQVLSQIKLPRVQLMTDETYNNTINAVAAPIKSGIKSVTCAACGVRGIYLTVRKKILSMFEGNTNSILDTLFSSESPVYNIVKEHINPILKQLEKPIVENFAAIMFDVSNKKLSVRRSNPFIPSIFSTELFEKEKGFAERLKNAEKMRAENEAKFRFSLQVSIDKAVADAKKAEDEKAAAAAKKRKQCGGGRRRKRRGRGRGRARTYKWLSIPRAARRRRKTLRIK